MIRYIDLINNIIGKILALLIFPIFFIMIYEVIARYIFNAPTAWGTELTQLLFGIYAVMSGGAVLLWDGHVNVDFLYGKLSDKERAYLDLFTSLLFFIFAGVLIYTGWKFALHSISILEHMETTWNPPIYPFKTAIPVAGFLLLFQGIANFIKNILIVLHKS